MPNPQTPPRHGEMAMIRRAATVTPNSIDVEARTFEVVWTTGATVPRRLYDWANDRIVEIDEVLSLAPGAVRMERLASGRAPLLNAHSNYDLEDIIGVVSKASVGSSEGRANLRMSKREEVEPIWRDVQDGIIANVSVGYDVHRWEITREEGKREQWVAVDWEPYEISLVPMGADDGAVVRDAQALAARAKPRTYATEFEYRATPATEQAKEIIMPEAHTESGSGNVAAQTVETIAATPAAAPDEETIRASERAYGLEIRKAYRDFGVDEKEADRDIEDRKDIHQVRAALQTKLAARSAQARQLPYQTGTGNERGNAREAMSEAMVARILDPRGKKREISEQAREYMEFGFADMAADFIGHKGRMTPGSRDNILHRAFNTTSDFPAFVENIANKVLLERYQTATPTYRALAMRKTFADLRPHAMVRAGDFPNLLQVGETGEIKAGTASESKETVTLATYARQIRLSRNLMINDDLDGLGDILGSIGERVADFENATFFALLTSASGAGPTLATDSLALFHTTHGNLTSSGTAISVDSLGVARALMMKQTSLDGLKLNITPSILLTSPDKLTVAEQLTSGIQPQQASNVNPFSGRLTAVADANLTTANPWYLFATPARAAVFVYGHLQGQEGPQVRTDEPFGVLGMALQVVLDFAVGAIDFRGAYRNAGA
jgi:hypothetical protein